MFLRNTSIIGPFLDVIDSSLIINAFNLYRADIVEGLVSLTIKLYYYKIPDQPPFLLV